MEKVINPGINNWVNNNKILLQQYRGMWVAFNETGIIAFNSQLSTLRQQLEKSQQTLSFYRVPEQFGKFMFRPIHFRSVFFHDWQPLYQVQISFESKVIYIPMLIDSGADGSLITYETGLELGLSVAKGESRQESHGIGGGKISYVWRDLEITIDGNTITAPVAWILEGSGQENIIGRQVVFDAWNIEFRQSEEKVLFHFIGQP